MDLDKIKQDDPMKILVDWLKDADKLKVRETHTMFLSTVSKEGQCFCRALLYKDVRPDGLVFFTNSNSRKGEQLKSNSKACILFYWDELFRQVQIHGDTKIISREDTINYWKTRHRDSQISQFISDQSHEVPNREFLEERAKEVRAKFDGKDIPCPENWNGYLLQPTGFEFWVGRDHRLHDRLWFEKKGLKWSSVRLSP